MTRIFLCRNPDCAHQRPAPTKVAGRSLAGLLSLALAKSRAPAWAKVVGTGLFVYAGHRLDTWFDKVCPECGGPIELVEGVIDWRARQGSNLRPLAPEANALSN